MRRVIRTIRNILLLLIAAIVVLAGVLAFNVATHGSRQLQVTAVPRVAVDAQGAATRLSEADQDLPTSQGRARWRAPRRKFSPTTPRR